MHLSAIHSPLDRKIHRGKQYCSCFRTMITISSGSLFIEERKNHCMASPRGLGSTDLVYETDTHQHTQFFLYGLTYPPWHLNIMAEFLWLYHLWIFDLWIRWRFKLYQIRASEISHPWPTGNVKKSIHHDIFMHTV